MIYLFIKYLGNQLDVNQLVQQIVHKYCSTHPLIYLIFVGLFDYQRVGTAKFDFYFFYLFILYITILYEQVKRRQL